MDLKKKQWICNNEAVTKATPEDFKSISNKTQVAVQHNAERYSVLGLQWTVTDNNIQVSRGTKKKFEAPITQRKFMSLVSSVFDPIRLFAPFY